MAKKASNIQLFLRTLIMIGVLVVGSMAAYHYGPPAEELAQVINSIAERIDWSGAQDHGDLQPLAADALPELTPLPSSEEGALTPIQTDEAAQIQPISFLEDQPPVDPTLRPIFAAGATEAEIESWGSSGGVYRAWAVVPADGLEQHYDALASTPEEAASRLLAQINQTGQLR